jgi:hypothetical protein
MTINSLNHQAAAEIRAEMARQRRTRVALAAELDWTYVYLNRRLREEVALSLDDIEAIAVALDTSILQLAWPKRTAS